MNARPPRAARREDIDAANAPGLPRPADAHLTKPTGKKAETMNTTQCSRFAEALSQRPDGPFPDRAASHLYSCPDCQALWDELLAIRMAAEELGASRTRAARTSLALVARPVSLRKASFASPNDQDGLPTGSESPPASPWAARTSLYWRLRAPWSDFTAIRPPLRHAARQRPPEPVHVQRLLASELNKTLDNDIERVVASLSERNAPSPLPSAKISQV